MRRAHQNWTRTVLVGYTLIALTFVFSGHWFPGVSFFNLLELHEAITGDLPPATHGLITTWRKILAIRNKSIKDPKFQFNPAMPERL